MHRWCKRCKQRGAGSDDRARAPFLNLLAMPLPNSVCPIEHLNVRLISVADSETRSHVSDAAVENPPRLCHLSQSLLDRWISPWQTASARRRRAIHIVRPPPKPPKVRLSRKRALEA